MADVSPAFFETIVLDLLHRMGYGANERICSVSAAWRRGN